MVTVLFEGQTIQIDMDPGSTLLDVLLKAQGEYWSSDQDLNMVKVNGKVLEPLTEETLSSIPAEGLVVELELSEKRPTPTLEGTIKEAIKYLETLPAGLQKLADQIRSDNSSLTFTSLKGSLEGIGFILDLLKTLHEHENTKPEVKEHIDSFSPEILTILKELNEAQQSGDLSLLSDLIEYELPEITQELIEIFLNFIETL